MADPVRFPGERRKGGRPLHQGGPRLGRIPPTVRRGRLRLPAGCRGAPGGSRAASTRRRAMLRSKGRILYESCEGVPGNPAKGTRLQSSGRCSGICQAAPRDYQAQSHSPPRRSRVAKRARRGETAAEPYEPERPFTPVREPAEAARRGQQGGPGERRESGPRGGDTRPGAGSAKRPSASRLQRLVRGLPGLRDGRGPQAHCSGSTACYAPLQGPHPLRLVRRGAWKPSERDSTSVGRQVVRCLSGGPTGLPGAVPTHLLGGAELRNAPAVRETPAESARPPQARGGSVADPEGLSRRAAEWREAAAPRRSPAGTDSADRSSRATSTSGRTPEAHGGPRSASTRPRAMLRSKGRILYDSREGVPGNPAQRDSTPVERQVERCLSGGPTGLPGAVPTHFLGGPESRSVAAVRETPGEQGRPPTPVREPPERPCGGIQSRPRHVAEARSTRGDTWPGAGSAKTALSQQLQRPVRGRRGSGMVAF